MTRDDLEKLEAKIMDEVVTRRRLGGYSVEAAGVLILFESILKMVQHMQEQLKSERTRK